MYSPVIFVFLQDPRFPLGLGVESDRGVSAIAVPLLHGNNAILGKKLPTLWFFFDVAEFKKKTLKFTVAKRVINLHWYKYIVIQTFFVGVVELYRNYGRVPFSPEEEEVGHVIINDYFIFKANEYESWNDFGLNYNRWL